jgi:hypothetical protein
LIKKNSNPDSVIRTKSPALESRNLWETNIHLREKIALLSNSYSSGDLYQMEGRAGVGVCSEGLSAGAFPNPSHLFILGYCSNLFAEILCVEIK